MPLMLPMPELIWINGTIQPLADARIGVEDRGFQFADGVYETLRLYNGKPFALHEHLDRLELSAAGIELPMPNDSDELADAMLDFAAQSKIADGFLYLQLTRGSSPRHHLFPEKTRPTLLFYARVLPPLGPIGEGSGQHLHSVADERWKRCWIKSIALLPNVLAKNAAHAAGADEAVFVEDEHVSECSSSNLFAVIDGTLVTAPVGPKVLPGITRAVLLNIAADLGIPSLERAMKHEEAFSADELFISSTTREVAWVSQWNGQKIATECGPITRKLHEAYRTLIERECC